MKEIRDTQNIQRISLWKIEDGDLVFMSRRFFLDVFI